MGERRLQLEQWLVENLKQMGIEPGFELTPASGDASFRRYFRVIVDGDSFIAMDAPPEHEDCRPFVTISKILDEAGLHVPRVLRMDLEHGFLLLTDLGYKQYLEVLDQHTVQPLYNDAMQALLHMQKIRPPGDLLPDYSYDLLINEMALFRDWFVNACLGLTLSSGQEQMLNETYEMLARLALSQPQVWVHRDYHSRNLMWVDLDTVKQPVGRLKLVNPGILDFQDAVIGPVCYDLVSLLRDCYISWPQQQVVAWVEHYRRDMLASGLIAETVTGDEFQRWFDWMGVQRHLKAIGIFARLDIRDGKPGYLPEIPRTLLYILQVCHAYNELHPMHAWLQLLIAPKVAELLGVDQGYFKTE